MKHTPSTTTFHPVAHEAGELDNSVRVASSTRHVVYISDAPLSKGQPCTLDVGLKMS